MKLSALDINPLSRLRERVRVRVQIVCTIYFLLALPCFAHEQLIIEPDMGREPIINFINNAHSSLNLVIYGFTDKRLLDALIQQKQHGKTLKIILEQHPYKAENQNNKTLQALNAYHIPWQGAIPPFRLIHQKTLVTDERNAMVMTFNFTRATFKNERNFALITDDPQQVKEIREVFAADWNHQSTLNHLPDLIWSPDDSRQKLLALIHQAKNTIKIYAQNINDYPIIGALAKSAKKGIQVKVLTSSHIHKKQKNYLARAGVLVHHSQYYIHAKVFIIDNQKAVLGSINLTKPSLEDNRELSLVTHDPDVIKKLVETFDKDWVSESLPHLPWRILKIIHWISH